MKNIKQIQYEVSKESRFDNWDLFLRCERYKPSLIDNKWTLVCERYAQQYIDANKELVEMLEQMLRYSETYNQDVREEAEMLINKYKSDEQGDKI